MPVAEYITMATANQKNTLSASRDIPFNKLVLSQSNVRRLKAGVSIEELAEDIARHGLLQSLYVRPLLDADGNETGMFEIPAGGRRYRALELLAKKKATTFSYLLPYLSSNCRSGPAPRHGSRHDEYPADRTGRRRPWAWETC